MNDQQEREALPPLPEPHAKVDGKLGTYCSFPSTSARRGDAVYTADQMHAYARAAMAATSAPAPKPCLVTGDCKHGNWCSEAYCQEHCKFVKEATPAQAQQAIEDQAAHDNAILEQGIQIGRTRERQAWEHEAATKAEAKPHPDTQDAERYRWLAEFKEWPDDVAAALDCGSKVMVDAAIDAARGIEASTGGSNG